MIKITLNHFSDTLSSTCLITQQGFSTSALRTFWAGSFFVAGAVLCVSRMFRGVSGLHPLHASCSPSPSVVTSKSISRHGQMPFGGQNHPSLKTTTRDI